MTVTIERLERVHSALAELVCEEPVYLPIFARVDAELEMARANSDPVLKARRLVKGLAA